MTTRALIRDNPRPPSRQIARTEEGFKYEMPVGVLFVGDSLLDAYFSGDNQTNRDLAAAECFTNITFYDFAHGGYALVSSDGTNAFMRSDTGATSSFYNTLRDNSPTITPEILVISLATNDTETSYTQSQWTEYYEDLIDEVLADYPSIQHVIIRILGRHTGNNTYLFNKRRASLFDVITNNRSGKVAGASEIYAASIAEAGGVHPDTAGYYELMRQLCGQMRALMKYGTMNGYRGPAITGTLIQDATDNVIQLTIDPDGGNRFTIPALAQDMFEVFITENAQSVNISPTDLVQISETQYNLIMESRLQGTAPELYYGYNTMYGLDNQSPPAVRSAKEPLLLPMRLAKPVVSIGASADLVKAIPGLQFDFDPARNPITMKTGTSTNEVQRVGSVNGRYFENQNSGHNPVLVANASNGKPGIKSVTNGAQMKPNAVGQASNQRGMILVGIAPNGASGSLMAQYGTTAADAQAGFQMSSASSGTLFWSRNSANGFTNVKTSFNLLKFMVAFIADSDGSGDVFFDNPLTPVVDEFTPKSNYGTDTALHLFGSSTANCLNNFTILRCFSFLGALGGAGPTLADLFTQFNTEYGLGKSW